MSEKIIAYKGMNADMTCRGKQYEIGKTYMEPVAKCCSAGMHACENPLDVLHYYKPDGKSRFFEVECSGDISQEDGKDSKLACTELKVTGEINLAKFLKLGAEATIKRVNKKIEEAKDKSKTAAGNYSVGSAAGNYSVGSAAGYYSVGSAAGYSSVGSAAGDYSVGSAAGNYSVGSAAGYYSVGSAAGDYSVGSAAGYYSVGSAAGNYSVGSAAGYSSVGSAAGNYSVGSAAGNYSRAEALGEDSIAVANGKHSKARGAMGCYLVLTEYDNDGSMICAKMSQVDGKTIKEKVWYTLKNGEFVEAEP